MNIYADRPARFLVQVLADVFALAWMAWWVWAAMGLHAAVLAFATPGELLEKAGGGLSSNMDTAAKNVREVPLAGDQLAKPFNSAGNAGESLSSAGVGFQESVGDMAFWLALVTAVIPIALVLLTWLPARARWIARASGARRLRAMAPEAASELLALRALSSARLGKLTAIHSDPVGAWRTGDAKSIDRFAALELHRMGLRA
ncbi:hypothetical protein CLV63_11115 [Murinocardiopsis flavida]|uniref:Transmembrane protein n=1 Tax=Murinocardiopsis flavida TaxID=645275 RepID=A0A2P8DGT4_9ACTN|nr:hypothetical protein [Murinocardiopsis flavida]PSK96421.1 hypothetical protein CLV63_11115 [Murinocardiopsis flavida]